MKNKKIIDKEEKICYVCKKRIKKEAVYIGRGLYRHKKCERAVLREAVKKYLKRK